MCTKLSFVNGNFDDIIDVFLINFPVEELIEISKTNFVALPLIESVAISHPWIDRSC